LRATPDAEHEQPERSDGGPESLARDGARVLGTAADPEVGTSLIANARHELRSPLQSIQGFAELLASEAYGPLRTEQRTFVEHIVQGSLELGTIIEACLELAEHELSLSEVHRSRVDLRTLLAEALEQARASLELGTIATEFAENTLGQRARVDPAAMRRAMAALCTALAGGPKRPALRATLELDGDQQARFVLSRVGAAEGAPLLALETIAARRRTARGLLWLRLAQVLFAAQDAVLRVSEQSDRAEVRFRLSSRH